MRSLLAALACCAVVIGAGCGGDGSGAGPSSTGLASALASVPNGDAAQASFAWSDVARIRQVAGFPDNFDDATFKGDQERFGTVLGTGAPNLAEGARILSDDLGIDLLAADTVLSVGAPPQVAIRLDGGVDASRVSSRLEDAGASKADSGGREVLSFGSGFDPGNPFVDAGLVSVKRVALDGQTLALAGDDAGLEQVLGDGDSLADSNPHAAMAECLGDVLSAYIVSGEMGGLPGDRLLGIGTRAPAADGSVEELACVVAESPKLADSQAALTRKRFRLDAPDLITGGTLGDHLDRIEVDRPESAAGDLVRATVGIPASGPAGFLFGQLVSATLPVYFGGSSPGPAPGVR